MAASRSCSLARHTPHSTPHAPHTRHHAGKHAVISRMLSIPMAWMEGGGGQRCSRDLSTRCVVGASAQAVAVEDVRAPTPSLAPQSPETGTHTSFVSIYCRFRVNPVATPRHLNAILLQFYSRCAARRARSCAARVCCTGSLVADTTMLAAFAYLRLRPSASTLPAMSAAYSPSVSIITLCASGRGMKYMCVQFDMQI